MWPISPKRWRTAKSKELPQTTPALKLLSACESTIKAVTPAAKEFEELQKFKNKRAGETLLIIHLAACYSELVNTIIGAEDCASSARIQAAADYTEVVSALLNDSTDVNAKNNNGETPLHEAVIMKNQVQTVEALLAAGSYVNAKNKCGRTPLDITIYKKWRKFFVML